MIKEVILPHSRYGNIMRRALQGETQRMRKTVRKTLCTSVSDIGEKINKKEPEGRLFFLFTLFAFDPVLEIILAISGNIGELYRKRDKSALFSAADIQMIPAA